MAEQRTGNTSLREEAEHLRRMVWLAARQAGGKVPIPLADVEACPRLPGLRYYRDGDNMVVEALDG